MNKIQKQLIPELNNLRVKKQRQIPNYKNRIGAQGRVQVAIQRLVIEVTTQIEQESINLDAIREESRNTPVTNVQSETPPSTTDNVRVENILYAPLVLRAEESVFSPFNYNRQREPESNEILSV